MGKASSAKKVARAAGTGGGRTSRGRTPWGWYGAISLVVILGIVVLVTSREDALERVGQEAAERPTRDDHWHAAYGFYLCDQFGPHLADNGRDPLGIHTHGDGIIHVHPFSNAASGKRAVTGLFFDAMGVTVNDTKIDYGGEEFVEGKDTCGTGKDKKDGVVRAFVNGEEVKGDYDKIYLEDRANIVFAFTAPDTEVPEAPPSAPTLNNLSDVPGSPGATSSTSQVPSDSTTTSTSAPPGGQGTTTSSTP
jgi:hypothetical protein